MQVAALVELLGELTGRRSCRRGFPPSSSTQQRRELLQKWLGTWHTLGRGEKTTTGGRHFENCKYVVAQCGILDLSLNAGIYCNRRQHLDMNAQAVAMQSVSPVFMVLKIWVRVQ